MYGTFFLSRIILYGYIMGFNIGFTSPDATASPGMNNSG